MKWTSGIAGVVFLCALSASTLEARPRIEVELLGGVPVNLSSRFEVVQEGYEDLGFTGRYVTRPTETPFYYAIRMGLGTDTGSWSLDFIHHKIYLDNGPPEVQHFEVTHGFNILTVQRSWIFPWFRGHVAAGFILARPENMVRGRFYAEQDGFLGTKYHAAGPAFGLGVGKRFTFGDHFLVTVEGRGTYAPVDIPVVDGEASFTSTAFHLLLGVGGTF